jgi:hypothetical protein
MVMRFGTWNVSTLLQAGNMNITAEEAERYRMEVAALQEMLWKCKGSIRKSKFTLYYSGNAKAQLGNRSLLYITLEMQRLN